MAKKAGSGRKASGSAPAAGGHKKILMNWFLIVIMVGSVGIALVSNSTDQQPTEGEPKPPSQAPTIIPFLAEDAEATVEDLFGAVVLSASTPQPDLAKIDAQLLAIPGVSRVNSQFRELTAAEAGPQKLFYFAEVIYDKAIPPNELLQHIQQQANFLGDVVVYPVGLVQLPETLHFVNQDLNLTRDYTPRDRFAQAFLMVDTQKGDSIKVHVQADLAGELVQQMTVYESQNPSNVPQLLEVSGLYEIKALGKNLTVLGDLPYSSKLPDVNALQKEALDVEAIVTGSVDFENPPLILQAQPKEAFAPKSADLNQMLYQVTGIRRVRLYDEENKVLIDFDSMAPYDDLKQEIYAVFAAAGFKKDRLEITDPLVRVTGVFDTASSQLGGVAQKLEAVFQKHGIHVQIYQPATLLAEKFLDPKTGNDYSIEGGEFQALVKPAHQEKDLVELGIQFLGKRDRAEKIQAMEGKPGEEQTIPLVVSSNDSN